MDATNSTLNMPQVLHCNMLLSSGARCLAGGCGFAKVTAAIHTYTTKGKRGPCCGQDCGRHSSQLSQSQLAA